METRRYGVRLSPAQEPLEKAWARLLLQIYEDPSATAGSGRLDRWPRGAVGHGSHRETAHRCRCGCLENLTRSGRIGGTTKSVGEPLAVADGRHAGRSIAQCCNVSFALAGVSRRLVNLDRLVGEPSRHANQQRAGVFRCDVTSDDVAPQLEQVDRVDRETTYGRKGVHIAV